MYVYTNQCVFIVCYKILSLSLPCSLHLILLTLLLINIARSGEMYRNTDVFWNKVRERSQTFLHVTNFQSFSKDFFYHIYKNVWGTKRFHQTTLLYIRYFPLLVDPRSYIFVLSIYISHEIYSYGGHHIASNLVSKNIRYFVQYYSILFQFFNIFQVYIYTCIFFCIISKYLERVLEILEYIFFERRKITIIISSLFFFFHISIN